MGVADLVRAAHDPDPGVRNNAVRALGVKEARLDTLIDDQAEAIIAAAKKSH